MAIFTEKTAAFLRQFVVKQASLLTLDSFLTKVAAALPMAKRAAFRAIQTELSSGNTLNHAIKVAFPRLSGEQRGALAVNLCKCAADSEYKKRTLESYAVPVKEGNKLMREKCSEDRPSFAGDTVTAPPAEPAPAGLDNSAAFSQILSSLAATPSRAAQAFGPGFSQMGGMAQRAGQKVEKVLPGVISGLTAGAIKPPAPESGPFSGINPYLLGALGIGGLGLGAYGASRMMRRKKRRDED
jgi:hypothetical protein